MSFSFENVTPDTAADETDTVEPVVRRRGRPPGSKNKPKEAGETNATSRDTDTVEAPRKRKRKPKQADIDFMAQRLIGLHSMLASFTGTPEFQLSDIEAKMLAESGLQVQREFDIEVGGKWAVLATFVGVAGVVYVPRFKAMKDRAKQRRASAQTHKEAPPYPTQEQPPGVTINGTAEYVQ
jgi:hypothetical protein